MDYVSFHIAPRYVSPTPTPGISRTYANLRPTPQQSPPRISILVLDSGMPGRNYERNWKLSRKDESPGPYQHLSCTQARQLTPHRPLPTSPTEASSFPWDQSPYCEEQTAAPRALHYKQETWIKTVWLIAILLPNVPLPCSPGLSEPQRNRLPICEARVARLPEWGWEINGRSARTSSTTATNQCLSTRMRLSRGGSLHTQGKNLRCYVR